MGLNPIYYAVEAVRPLFLSGIDWEKIAPALPVLLTFSVVGMAARVLALKKTEV